MLSALLLLLHTLCYPLRLGSTGSFPRPLKAEEERAYLERLAQGDLEARNKLVEHNLRLVSHILKKYYVPFWTYYTFLLLSDSLISISFSIASAVPSIPNLELSRQIL